VGGGGNQIRELPLWRKQRQASSHTWQPGCTRVHRGARPNRAAHVISTDSYPRQCDAVHLWKTSTPVATLQHRATPGNAAPAAADRPGFAKQKGCALQRRWGGEGAVWQAPTVWPVRKAPRASRLVQEARPREALLRRHSAACCVPPEALARTKQIKTGRGGLLLCVSAPDGAPLASPPGGQSAPGALRLALAPLLQAQGLAAYPAPNAPGKGGSLLWDTLPNCGLSAQDEW
jgi:hypothetical protein